MPDLDAIRARDAECDACSVCGDRLWTGEDVRHDLTAEQCTAERAPFLLVCGEPEWHHPYSPGGMVSQWLADEEVVADRRDLLAEVDRLTADVKARDVLLRGDDALIRAERARIRAAVEAFPDWAAVDRHTVLAAIDGETP